MLKLATHYCYTENSFGDDLRILLLVHDEIVVEAKNEILEDASKFLVGCMDKAFKYFVTVIDSKVDAQVKLTWTK
jgi:DNA polymerase I-like protein with 3'-5' exonuclease and polymerase domains